jgi:hypothetical protein
MGTLSLQLTNDQIKRVVIMLRERPDVTIWSLKTIRIAFYGLVLLLSALSLD